jgi:V/A-type H+-transporting ATPase subunit E
MNDPEKPQMSGVQRLIDRLRQEGIVSGQQEARRLVEDAETRVRWMIDQASREAEEIRDAARRDAERLTAAGKEALRIACRDALLDLKAQLTTLFHEELKREVSRSFDTEAMLRGIILALARDLGTQVSETPMSIELPARAADLQELRRNPEELAAGPLTDLARHLANDLLTRGIELQVSRDLPEGIRLKLDESRFNIEFTPETVSELLMAHLQPRFRALLEGIVR